jgi:hypothetical protein
VLCPQIRKTESRAGLCPFAPVAQLPHPKPLPESKNCTTLRQGLHFFPFRPAPPRVFQNVSIGWSNACTLFLRETVIEIPCHEISTDSLPRAAIVVAHPDDETLWCGGYILNHPEFRWRIVTLCRASDPDRAPKFRRVLRQLNAEGAMADLDDGPGQARLPVHDLRQTAAELLAGHGYDLVLTHGPGGEYTSHRRHSECSRTVVDLWLLGSIDTKQMWLFAYQDGGRAYLPRVRDDADWRDMLTEEVWIEKRRLITDVYGFGPSSWETRTTPREEGFWCFDSAQAAVARAASWEQSAT